MSSFVLVIFLGIPLLSLSWWFWADCRLKALGTGAWPRIALSAGTLLLLASFTWVILARRDMVVTPIPSQLYATVLLWGLIFLPFLALPSMLVWALGSLGNRIFRSKKSRSRLRSEAGTKGGWSRRRILGSLATGLPLVATFGTAAFSLPRTRRFRIREVDISLKDLPESLEGLRIAHITDTHVGKFTRGNVLSEIVAATKKLDADLVLFTGDLIDNSIRDLPAAVGMISGLHAKSGVFIVEGNHDLFDDPAGFVKGVKDAGINLLRNEASTVNIRGHAVQLLGIVWKHGEEEMAEDVDTVSAMRDPKAFHILLAHHPHAFDQAVKNGIPLTLAGHTHGGQLMLTQEVGAGPMMFRFWSGLYRKEKSALVVGNGTGNWFPLRVNAPAEIVHITLWKA